MICYVMTWCDMIRCGISRYILMYNVLFPAATLPLQSTLYSHPIIQPNGSMQSLLSPLIHFA